MTRYSGSRESRALAPELKTASAGTWFTWKPPLTLPGCISETNSGPATT